MSLPRLLIIDDLYGRDLSSRLNFCNHLGIWDLERGEPTEQDYLATAHFCSGQEILKSQNKTIFSNHLESAIEAVSYGWSQNNDNRWSLVLVDFEFLSGILNPGEKRPAGQKGDKDFGAKIVAQITQTFPAIDESGRRTTEPTDIPLIMFSTHEPEIIEPLTDPHGSRAFFQRPEHWDNQSQTMDRQKLAELLFQHALVKDGTLSRVTQHGEIVKIRAQPEIIGNSLALLKSLRAARQAVTKAGRNLVLFYGESGVGKELIVKYAHEHLRGDKEFIPVDLNNISSELIDSELFGYDTGVFTGQLKEGKHGYLQAAGQGSLFIDEIGNCRPETLNKLLRVTSSGDYNVLGQRKSKQINCQILCATNKPLIEWCTPELLNRTESFIALPSLRNRKEDIRDLYDFFVEKNCKEFDCRSKTTDPNVYNWMESLDWTVGNIRELESAVKYAVKKRKNSGTIQIFDLLEKIEQMKNLQYENLGIKPEKIDSPQQPPLNFNRLLDKMNHFTFQEDEVCGALPKFNNAVGSIIARLFDAAYLQKKDNFTGCLKLIMGVNALSTDVAINKFRKIVKNNEYKLAEKSPVVFQFKEEKLSKSKEDQT